MLPDTIKQLINEYSLLSQYISIYIFNYLSIQVPNEPPGSTATTTVNTTATLVPTDSEKVSKKFYLDTKNYIT